MFFYNFFIIFLICFNTIYNIDADMVEHNSKKMAITIDDTHYLCYPYNNILQSKQPSNSPIFTPTDLPINKPCTNPPNNSPTNSPTNSPIIEQNNNKQLNFEVKNGDIYMNNEIFHIKGINWFGYEGGNQMLFGLSDGKNTIDGILLFLQQNNFNTIRIPFCVSTIISNPVIPSSTVTQDSGLQGLTIQQSMQKIVNKAAEYNILIMFDLHQLRPDSGISELWYDSQTSTSDVLKSWNIISSLFCNQWNVIAADLKNEPHGSATWGDGNPSTDWHLAAQQIGNSVLQTCPRLLIFVGGISGNGGWWGGRLDGIKNNPINLQDNTKLVYSPHVYGPNVFMQSYFSDSNFPNNMPDIWNADFGFIKQQNIQALNVGEFGGFYTEMDKVWQDAFVEYLVKNKIGSFYWTLNPESSDTKGILLDDWKTPDNNKLNLLSKLLHTKIT